MWILFFVVNSTYRGFRQLRENLHGPTSPEWLPQNSCQATVCTTFFGNWSQINMFSSMCLFGVKMSFVFCDTPRPSKFKNFDLSQIYCWPITSSPVNTMKKEYNKYKHAKINIKPAAIRIFTCNFAKWVACRTIGYLESREQFLL